MSYHKITLFLIDDDPIFRLGLATALAVVEDLEILAQGDTQELREKLREQIPDLIVVDPASRGWQLPQQLKQEYPQIKICLFCSSLSEQDLLAAKNAGIEGYCPKGRTIEELVQLLRHIASGATYWQYLSTIISSNYQNSTRGRKWLVGLFGAGIAQIEENISLINNKLDESQLSRLDWLFWTGRRRELLASRWIVRQLMPPETGVYSTPSESPTNSHNSSSISVSQETNLPVIIPASPLTVSSLLNETLQKIQLGGENASNMPLEIDILYFNKRRELLYLVYSQIEKLITEFPLLNITSEELQERLSLIIVKIWEESTCLFIEFYYPNKKRLLEGLMQEIIEGEFLSVQQDILTKIPFTEQLFSFLLFENNVLVEQVEYRANSPEAIERAGILLENLVIQIANAVMAVVLNNFSNNEIMKEKLFKNDIKSSREIAQFRNKLSEKYTIEKYWGQPKDIFESQYRLYCFNRGKINKIFIRSSRYEELNKLTGIPWVVTIILETRDAIAPPVRAIIGLLGKGIVYVLTSIIGRGIGLIGRGIIQGIGNTLQQTKYGKNSK